MTERRLKRGTDGDLYVTELRFGGREGRETVETSYTTITLAEGLDVVVQIGEELFVIYTDKLTEEPIGHP